MELSILKKRLDNRISTDFKPLLLPKILGKVATGVPAGLNRKVIEYVLNQAFEEQVKEGDFTFLTDEQLQIEISDANIFVGISFIDERLICTHFNSSAGPATATLSINVFDAIQLIEQVIDPDTLFFQRKLKIQGDTELAHQAKNTIDTLDQSRLPSFLIYLLRFYKDRFAS